MTYPDLMKALEIFGLTDRVTLRDIKNRHRELVRRCHPDAGAPPDSAEIRLINAAYRLLCDYVVNYRFSFSREEFYEQNPEERLRMQFEGTPLWDVR
ncbi:DnaJ family molecular chaperone [Geobacter sp.]|uniref:J domain-containing protein n=1 Tax=Geobacter sp. TaxID=46610 RepID=UPI00262087E2|nr:J domain-containing protein [Geobacter sp.]